MVVNENACLPDTRVVLETIASKLAPTGAALGEGRHHMPKMRASSSVAGRNDLRRGCQPVET